jgi:hypothetical protein
VLVRIALTALLIPLIAGCAARQTQDSLTGATAQRLVSHSVDRLAERLPDGDFEPLAGKRLRIESHFVADPALREYADRRLAIALRRRFGVEVVRGLQEADSVLNVFYTALGTNRDTKGFFLPLGYLPGLDAEYQIDLITLEQFHGVAELYYFVGPTGIEARGPVLQSRTRTEAIGLPIITIPINDVKRE